MLVVVVIGVVLAGVAATTGWRIPMAAAAQASFTTRIGFEIEGDGGYADYAVVYTRSEVIRFVPSRSTRSYEAAVAAVLVVRAKPGHGPAVCRLRINDVVVDQQEANGPASATCIWVAGTVDLPRITAD